MCIRVGAKSGRILSTTTILQSCDVAEYSEYAEFESQSASDAISTTAESVFSERNVSDIQSFEYGYQSEQKGKVRCQKFHFSKLSFL